MMMMHKYKPLQYPDSIRLLTLHPGEELSPIKISLLEVRSRDDTEYEALSYTWATEDGDDSRSSFIECNSGQIWVTKNCEAALRRLREQDSERVLWVDAISIDQDNIDERGHQVKLMQDIYSKATEVLIWLGEASKDVDDETGLPVSDIFLQHLGQMSAEIQELQSDGKSSTASPLYQKVVYHNTEAYKGKSKHPLIRGLRDICNRHWWRRIWVVQEAAVAKSATFLCSEHAVKYSDFYLWYRVLSKDNNPEAQRLRLYTKRSKNHLKCVHQSKKAAEFIEAIVLLHEVRYLQASDPRDKIFGILGLSDGFRSLLPSPDYNKSTIDIFTDVAKALLSQTKSLQILVEAISGSLVLGYPSWVPDWSQRPPVLIRPWMYNYYNAASGSEANYEISVNNEELQIFGKGIDMVEKVAVPDLTVSTDLSITLISGLQESCRIGLSLQDYPTGEDVREVLWRTFCWNVTNQPRYPAPREFSHLFENWYRILTSGLEPGSVIRNLHVEAFNENIMGEAGICITVKGFLASAPRTTEVGDCIAILSGGRVPFILRPTGDHYRLIGPCYVHGIMDGEAFPKDSDELESFSIR